MRRKGISFLILFICSVFGGCPSGYRSRVDDCKENCALWKANDFMHKRYSEAKKLILSSVEITDPIIICDTNNDTMSLRFNNQTFIYSPVSSTNYNNLKMVAHVAFSALLLLEPTVYNAIDNSTQYELSKQDIEDVTNYFSLLIPVNQSLDTCCGFEGDLLQRQRNIVNSVQIALSTILNTGTVSADQVNELASITVPWLNQNIKEASIDMVNTIHEQVMKWKRMLTDEQWKRIHVIVLSSHMPRKGQLQMQYFARLLHSEITSGLRIVYAENVQTEEEALRLLSTHLVDFTAGDAFWKNAEHMHIDIQAQAVKDYLPHILPPFLD